MRLSKFRPAPISEIIITNGPGWLIFSTRDAPELRLYAR